MHRDLKPTNVLTTRIEQYVVLKVLDFGIGGIATEQEKRAATETAGQNPFTETAGTCTPLYHLAAAAPTPAAGPDPRDDVYALGVIWYQMLVGDVTKEPPRGGSWKKRLLDQGTTPNMLALLERCLEDDPPDRPADAQVLAQELQGVIKEAAEPGPVAVLANPVAVPAHRPANAAVLAEPLSPALGNECIAIRNSASDWPRGPKARGWKAAVPAWKIMAVSIYRGSVWPGRCRRPLVPPCGHWQPGGDGRPARFLLGEGVTRTANKRDVCVSFFGYCFGWACMVPRLTAISWQAIA